MKIELTNIWVIIFTTSQDNISVDSMANLRTSADQLREVLEFGKTFARMECVLLTGWLC